MLSKASIKFIKKRHLLQRLALFLKEDVIFLLIQGYIILDIRKYDFSLYGRNDAFLFSNHLLFDSLAFQQALDILCKSHLSAL